MVNLTKWNEQTLIFKLRTYHWKLLVKMYFHKITHCIWASSLAFLYAVCVAMHKRLQI